MLPQRLGWLWLHVAFHLSQLIVVCSSKPELSLQSTSENISSDDLQLQPESAQDESDGSQLKLNNLGIIESDESDVNYNDLELAQDNDLDTVQGKESNFDFKNIELDKNGESRFNFNNIETVKGDHSSDLECNTVETAEGDECDFNVNNTKNTEEDINPNAVEGPEVGESEADFKDVDTSVEHSLDPTQSANKFTVTKNPIANVSVKAIQRNPYVWDKEKQRPLDFLMHVCPNRCVSRMGPKHDVHKASSTPREGTAELNSNRIKSQSKPSGVCKNFACFPCDCQAGAGDTAEEEGFEHIDLQNENTGNMFCVMGNCCPGRKLQADPHYSNRGQYTGHLAQRQDRAYAIVRCPRDSTHQTLRHACERGKGEFTTDEPVTDNTTDIVYRNKACAECHGVNSSTPWRLQIACAHFQYFYMAKSEQELLQRIKDAGPGVNGVCIVKHVRPSNTVDKPKSLRFFNSSDGPGDRVIRTCNVTGLWIEFDKHLQSGCATYTALVFRVRVNLSHYTNLFCAMCNGFQPERYRCTPHGFPGDFIVSDIPLPLTFLLGLKNRREVHAGNSGGCALRQWLDFDNMCRNLNCSAGKVLYVDNRTCSTAVRLIRGLFYQIDISLVPQKVFLISPFLLNTLALERAVVHTLRNKTQGLTAEFSVAVLVHTVPYHTNVWSQRLEKTVRVDVSCNITATFHIERDEVEERLIENLLIYQWEMLIKSVGQVVFTPVPYDRDDETPLPVFTDWEQFEKRELELSAYHDNPLTKGIPLTRLLTCAFVTFGTSEFKRKNDVGGDSVGFRDGGNKRERVLHLNKNSSSKQDNDFREKLMTNVFGKIVLMQKEIFLADLQFSWMIDEDGNLQVCIDRLEELLTRHKGRSASFWQYALSMTAIPLSLLCLLLVLIVYALLPALRTQPGLNTMGTCTTLLVAQLTLVLASHRVFSGLWCIALGILVHVSWLSTFCWTSVNSLHMFRAFSSSTNMSSGAGSYQVLAVNTAVTLLVPGVVVAIVMGQSWYRSGGQSIGYSASTCYLDSTLMVGLSVVLPLSLIVVFNLLLYTVTVYRIQKICSLQARAVSETVSGQQHVRACLRLSLLTGTTWLLSLVAEGLDLHWLRALAILTNGGQGALLLHSYVTRRRVISMLTLRLGCKGDATSITTNSTMAGSKT